MIDGKKIALVLSGGASKGFAHIGVIKILEKNGIVPDMIVGTSMGSVIGGLYACGMSVDEIETQCKKLKLKDFVDVNIFDMWRQGVVTGKKMTKYIDELVHGATIENAKIKFACVACDLRTGNEFIFKEGKLGVATRVSSSIPGLFAPYKYRDMLLVDGGVINNNPTSVARDMGADFIISVDCIGSHYLMPKLKNMFDILMCSFNIQQFHYEKCKKKFSNVKIVINNNKYSFMDLGEKAVGEIIGFGERATKKKLAKIKRDLHMS